MNQYKGDKNAIKMPIIGFIVIVAALLFLIFLANRSFWTYALAVIFLLILPMFYSGIIFKITIDDEKVKVYRLGYIDTIKFKDIAICADHAIDDERSIIYCFVRSGKYVKALRQKIEFDQVIKMVSDSGNMHDLDLNFNRSKKIQVSFVENGKELKSKIINKINEEHIRVLKELS